MKKPELLLPAGSPEALETAFLYGADAVYAGLSSLSLRTTRGFGMETLREAIEKAHRKNKKIYLTLNLFSKNSDLDKLSGFAQTVNLLDPDGLIVSDPGVFMFMKKHAPSIPLHISTQANVGSSLTVDFWRSLGAKACVLSRETSFAEICEIKKQIPDMKIEMFIHGSMCMSYSGRCLLSSFLTGRSANRGQCAHVCRWKYKLFLQEESRPFEFFPIQEDERGTYIMNSKDLCLMPKLDLILKAGIDLLKVEGRNKTPYYVAQTARVYRKAIDDWFENPDDWDFKPYQAELDTLQNRGYTFGFFDGVPDGCAQNYESTQSVSEYRNAAVISDWTEQGAEAVIYQKINSGDTLSFLSPYHFSPVDITISRLIDGFSKKEVGVLSPGRIGQSIFIPRSFFGKFTAAELPVFTVARLKVKR